MATKTDANNATIPALPVKPSKEEEIQFFRAVVESIPEDSYLSRMFAGTVEHVERTIRNDFTLVSYVETIDAGDRAARERNALSVEIDQLKATIARQNENMIFASEEAVRLGAVAGREKARADAAEATIAQLEAEIEVLEANEAIRSAERQLDYQKTKYQEAAARLAAIRGA